MYEHYRISTFQGDLYNGPWHAAPPTDLALAVYAGGAYTPLAARTGSAGDAVKLSILDNCRLKRLAVFCNFADGLILQRRRLAAIIGLARNTPAGQPPVSPITTLPFGTVAIPIPLLNTWVETNIFVSDKKLVQAAIQAGTIQLSDTLTLAGAVFPHDDGYAIYCTQQVNPALAALADPPAAGSANIIFTLACEIEHTFGEV
jgi:hypothetical protein